MGPRRTARTLRYLPSFDSSVAMMRATARFLRGKDFPALAAGPSAPRLGALLNALPERARERGYIATGYGQGIPLHKVRNVSSEDMAAWMVRQYRAQSYPGVMIGSGSGALVHLCAALGMPWLAQTILVLLRQKNIHPDEPAEAMEAGRQLGRTLLSRNPDVNLYHMHDPNQDRAMLERAMYFRLKRLRLGETLERFLRERLRPDGTIFLVECRREWPTTQVGERHIFQHGALGGATPQQYFEGGPAVEEYLVRYSSHRRRWDPPAPDADRPEAEWGFEPALRADIERFAGRHGFEVRSLVFEEPEHLSPLVAELYRWWYRRRGIPGDRLLVESYDLLEPWWTLKTGAVPFWIKFNMQPSFEWLERYLDEADPYDFIHMMLFSHSVESIGLLPLERWRTLLERARIDGEFLALDPQGWPKDLGNVLRYQSELKRLPARHSIPPPLSLDELDRFLQETDGRFPVRWEKISPAALPIA